MLNKTQRRIQSNKGLLDADHPSHLARQTTDRKRPEGRRNVRFTLLLSGVNETRAISHAVVKPHGGMASALISITDILLEKIWTAP
ncbi:hypothetical protein J8I87_30470 [Paraburkholderia sp. LEh10]|uniref:hypothetical protein n=1 Tax=Paraburkholderia sp. LEh10 TaxID=2821353 RepID=UPI001AE4D58B|nr:hypothetical protein [Paraburkholderia sp. LEh10]MBP0593929.1 hypothetical protein [Paraburkholderia sp. LEh10]